MAHDLSLHYKSLMSHTQRTKQETDKSMLLGTIMKKLVVNPDIPLAGVNTAGLKGPGGREVLL